MEAKINSPMSNSFPERSRRNQRTKSTSVFLPAVLAVIAVLSLLGVILALHRHEQRSYNDGLMCDSVRRRYVEEIAEFAVAEYNKRLHKKVVLARESLISAGEVQLVGGTKYKLFFSAKDEETLTKSALGRYYEAVVLDLNWINVRILVSFNRFVHKFPPSTD